MTGAVWLLSGFGDEIDPAPEVQVAVLRALDAPRIEVRSAWNVNVAEWSEVELDRYRQILSKAEVTASVIASPIGKVDVGVPTEEEVARLGRMIEVARRLDSRLIRIFSFFCGARGGPAANRSAVLTKMAALARAAERAGVVLIHENEKEIYGDTPERVLDLIESVGSPALRVAWDSANFVQVGVEPYARAYPLLAEHIAHLHIKDAVMGTGEVVLPGEGDGALAQIIAAQREAGYRGYVSLEPHLAEVGTFGGSSGPQRFGQAARALRALTERMGVQLG